MDIDIDSELERIARQEQRLRLPRLGADKLWALGTTLKAMAESRGLAVTIEIRQARETVFFFAMPGTTPANADWARRKRNAVELLQRSSYAIGLSLRRDGNSLEAGMGLPPRDYASHGGSFPLRLTDDVCVGVVTVSGLPQHEDHALVVEALATMCGVPLDEVTL